MAKLNPDILVLIIAGLLTLPGLFALYRGLHLDLKEQNLHLQVESMGNEIQRLQVLADDQARELSRLRVDVASLRITQKMLVENMTKLAQQVRNKGDVPIVDVDALVALLS